MLAVLGVVRKAVIKHSRALPDVDDSFSDDDEFSRGGEGYWERGYRERTYLASKAIVVR